MFACLWANCPGEHDSSPLEDEWSQCRPIDRPKEDLFGWKFWGSRVCSRCVRDTSNGFISSGNLCFALALRSAKVCASECAPSDRKPPWNMYLCKDILKYIVGRVSDNYIFPVYTQKITAQRRKVVKFFLVNFCYLFIYKYLLQRQANVLVFIWYNVFRCNYAFPVYKNNGNTILKFLSVNFHYLFIDTCFNVRSAIFFFTRYTCFFNKIWLYSKKCQSPIRDFIARLKCRICIIHACAPKALKSLWACRCVI